MEDFMKKIISGCIVLAALIYGFISCAFPFQSTEHVELSDINDRLGFNEISRQAFMGGSVLYNPDQPSTGTLAPGVHLAVRLGKVDKNENSIGQPSFSDREDAARYGFITINAIDTSQISFTYTQYEGNQHNQTARSFSLPLNEKADLDRDGYSDITYVKPIRNRPGMEKAVYLTFLSSKETLNTAMFAVLPEQYSRGVYPGGIIGINPSGQFIVTKYERANSSIRAAVQGVVYGDYVLDYSTGTYQQFTGSSAYRSARSIDDSELTDIRTMENMNAYFFIQEFDEAFTAENLFNALPETIQNRFGIENRTNEDLLPILNTILERYDLIESIAAVKNIKITDTELMEVRTSIQTLGIPDIVLINRLFLSENYPEVCPIIQSTSNDAAFIFPLLHCIIRGDEDTASDAISRGVATTYASYTQQRNSIRSQFSKYTPIGGESTVPLPYPLNNAQNKIVFGIYGVIENNWGKSIKLGVVIQKV
jgi:hypothetical protein